MADYRECDVGMAEHLGIHKGFSGILKMRYEDFLVNEIDKDNNVLHFTSMLNNIQPEEKATPDTEISIDLSLLSSNEQDSLKQLQDGSFEDSFVLITAGNDKTKRTQLHQLIRQTYPQLESETVNDGDNDEKKIKVTKSNGNGLNKRRRQSKAKRTLTQFLLYKENVSTMDAVNVILKKLHLKYSRCFQYAGNKDKRAVTVQAMTTSIPVERLLIINSATRNIRVGNFKTCQNSLQLGDLWGNRFSIALRNVEDVKRVEMSEGVSSLSNVGFVNYFGMQRFGTNKTPTYHIGKALLASKWADAVDLILSSVKDEDESLLKLIGSWRETGQAAEAYKKLRNKSSFEGFLLQGIAQHGSKQIVQALCRIPRPTRLLYLHSYQSYIWNHVVSHRLHHFGHSPAVGDFVLVNKQGSDDMKDDDDEAPERKRQKLKNQSSGNSNRGLPEVKVLTEDDVSQYQLTDLVLPLPGSQVVYPSNIKDYYVQLLQEDQLDMNVFNHKVKDYSLTGAYRKIVVRPSNVEWSITEYDDLNTPLFVTDLKKINKNNEVSNTQAAGRFRAFCIHFDLPSSSYATVALRELTKADMSVTVQSELGEKHKVEVAGTPVDAATLDQKADGANDNKPPQ